jgi:hypothetical protein
MAPPPSPPTPSLASKLEQRHTGRLRKKGNLLTEKGVLRVGEEPDHTTAGKAWSSINHSILSGANNGNLQSERRFSILKPIKNWIRILHQVLHIMENLKKI